MIVHLTRSAHMRERIRLRRSRHDRHNPRAGRQFGGGSPARCESVRPPDVDRAREILKRPTRSPTGSRPVAPTWSAAPPADRRFGRLQGTQPARAWECRPASRSPRRDRLRRQTEFFPGTARSPNKAEVFLAKRKADRDGVRVHRRGEDGALGQGDVPGPERQPVGLSRVDADALGESTVPLLTIARAGLRQLHAGRGFRTGNRTPWARARESGSEHRRESPRTGSGGSTRRPERWLRTRGH